MKTLRTLFDLLRQTFTEWTQDNAPRLAAALAYYIAFSLAPLLVLTIALAGFILREQFVREEVLGLVTSSVGEGAAALVDELMTSLRQPSSGILSTVLGIAALLFGAIGVFDQLKAALNTVWGVSAEDAPKGIMGFVRGKLISFGMVAVIGVLLLVSLILSTLLSAFDAYLASLLPGLLPLLQALNLLLSFGLVTLCFALIYRILPDLRLEWRDVWMGAAFTALLFTLGKTALGWYLGNAGTASAYGAAGGFVLILLWIYYSAQIILFGAEFTQVYARRFGSLRERMPTQA